MEKRRQNHRQKFAGHSTRDAPRWPFSPLASTPTSPYPLPVLVSCLSSRNARPRCREPAPTSCSPSPATSVLRSMEQRPKHSRLPCRPVRGADLLHRSAPKSCAREPGVLSAANELWRELDALVCSHSHVCFFCQRQHLIITAARTQKESFV